MKKIAVKKAKLGSLSAKDASNKRVGPIDPQGAWTKVQKATLAGARGSAKLTKDKELGATKMAKRGRTIKKAQNGSQELRSRAQEFLSRARVFDMGSRGGLTKMYRSVDSVPKRVSKDSTFRKAKDGKWIQKAIKKPGALRAQLGAKPGKPIPAGKLAKAAKAKGKLGQRARLAQTLKKMRKK